ncbi:PRC-barrel domain protein [Clostridium sp. N3C]|uniref:PRC-barrel domain-containing protein n=1 Tax=Clostridium sp. N3C TaxID=1776758 RepID=UPI00092E0390|nr:PRC-barrel domain-containing protein [Clostridium sp. N3C]SCN22146.1 PRC-barrel domain protein [Clostridium sp. N3C]
MYRLKDFLSKKVMYSNGKKVGTVTDLAVNFSERKIKGFAIRSTNIFGKKSKIALIEDVIYFDDDLIVDKVRDIRYLTFSSVKGMEVIDLQGNIIGIVEDLLFDGDFNMKGMIISPGILRKIKVGKGVLLINDIIIGDGNVLYYGKNNIRFSILRHSISGGHYYE